MDHGLHIGEELLILEYYINLVTMKISKMTGISAKARPYLSLKSLHHYITL